MHRENFENRLRTDSQHFQGCKILCICHTYRPELKSGQELAQRYLTMAPSAVAVETVNNLPLEFETNGSSKKAPLSQLELSDKDKARDVLKSKYNLRARIVSFPSQRLFEQ